MEWLSIYRHMSKGHFDINIFRMIFSKLGQNFIQIPQTILKF